jgi:hypothetical protein
MEQLLGIEPRLSKFDELMALEDVWLNTSAGKRTWHPSFGRDFRDGRGDRPGP